MKKIISTMFFLLACVTFAQAQRGGGNDWLTENADAQRTATIKTDAKINTASVTKPESFRFLWKLKLKYTPNQLNNLTPPATLERLIGFKGFRMLGFVAGSGDNLITIDTDLGRLEWEKKLPAAASTAISSLTCPGGMTTGVVRPAISAIATGGGGGNFGPGRSNPAKSTVGEPLAGAANLAAKPPQPQGPPGPPPGMQPPRPGGAGPARPGAPPVGAGFGGVSVIYALASDGLLHGMHLSNGAAYQDPIKFLPPGANASGLIIVDGAAYVATTQGCGGAANGLYAYDFESQKVSNWKGEIVGSAGAAFGGDGTAFVATTNGITALAAKTLEVKGTYAAAGQEFSSTPVIFQFNGKTFIAAATKDGSLHLLDAANLSAGVASAIATTAAAGKDSAPGSLASYQDAAGTRWILAAHNGALPAGFTGSAVTKGAILAWKLVETGGKLTLAPGWASRNLVAPLTPTVINGVVFATSSGEVRTKDAKLTAARSGKAVIYALDGATGKELWTSGTTITSFARGGALSGGIGQLYLTTYDGTIYAFGYPMEH